MCLEGENCGILLTNEWMGGERVGERELSNLPRMDALLAAPALADSGLPRALQKAGANRVLEGLRRRLLAGEEALVPPLPELACQARRAAEELARPGLRRVVNATGVVLHTNLGRAPLSPRAAAAAAQAAAGYSNLEYDLAAGSRGSRTTGVEQLLRELTGAEGAFAVNNNAAAVLLMLSVLAPGLGVAISRGELVEIGGAFRVPDIMARSGARLVEVGTTNKTRLSDYEGALAQGQAQALLKVHPSNFKVVGFTQAVAPEELARLAARYQAPLLCDLGSGAPGPGPWPADYPTAAKWAAAADVVCFSGDKLLGGPQAGILVGRAEPIRRLKADPLARALRLDKLSLAALEATLLDWRDGVAVPVRAMLEAAPEQLRRRAEELAALLAPLCPCRAAETDGEAGGGALPGERLPSWAAVLSPPCGPEGLEAHLRGWDTPVLGRIHKGKLLLDVRTLLPGEEAVILAALAAWKGEGI